MAAVFTIFSSSPLPLNFVALQRRLAFLLAMESSRCPSKVASLQCSIYGYPCRLCPLPPVSTKQDGSPWSSGPAHSGPAFSGGVVSLCPVASLEDFLEFWCSHGVRHDFLSSPFSPLSTAAFSELLRWAFRRAGIDAPGSTRHVWSQTPSLAELMFLTVWLRVIGLASEHSFAIIFGLGVTK